MKLSPETQAEYDALGLPWKFITLSAEPQIFSIAEQKYISPLGAVSELHENYILKAANRHHELEEKVERLRKALKYVLINYTCPTKDQLMFKDALKETEEANAQ